MESAKRSRASMLSVKSSIASSTNWRQPSVCSRATARARRQGRRPQPKCRPPERRRLLQRDYAGAGALRPQNQLAAAAARRASTIRFLPWQPARRSKKSPLHARALARTMSAPLLPGTSGLAASKSATESSTPHGRRERSNAPRSDPGIEKDGRPPPKGAAEWTGSSLRQARAAEFPAETVR